MHNTNISIIIPVFNGLEFTKKGLKSLFDQKKALGEKGENLQVVLVDDGSKDGTAEWVGDHFPAVHLVYGDGGLWWSGGINKGARFALEKLKSEYILWWNNDILPRNDYFENLLQVIDENASDVLIGSKVFVLNQNLVWGMGGKFDPVTGTRFMYGERQKDNESLMAPLKVDWFPGMGTTIHRSVFEKIGFLDEKNFPQYHGDSDFTLRAKAAGFKLIAFPQLVIYNDNTNTGLFHQGSFSRLYRSLTGIKSIYGFKRDLKFLKKHTISFRAYIPFFKKYYHYIGGFFKWKVLNALGVKKVNHEA